MTSDSRAQRLVDELEGAGAGIDQQQQALLG